MADPLMHDTEHIQSNRSVKRKKTTLDDQGSFETSFVGEPERKSRSLADGKRLVKMSLMQLSTFYNGRDDAKKLSKYFFTDGFKKICENVFKTVDMDNSKTIDKNELLNAFIGVMQKIPHSAKVVKFGLDERSNITKLGVKFVEQTWNLLDDDGNGSLDPEEFSVAMMLLWAEAVKIRSKALAPKKLIKNSMDQLYSRFPKDKVDGLAALFDKHDFAETCRSVFLDVDHDENKKLDKTETLHAFREVCKHHKGLRKQLGKDFDSFTAREGKILINQCFSSLDSDSSGYLELGEFEFAMKVFMIQVFYLVEKMTMEKIAEEPWLQF